jgi:BolA protein
MTTRADRIRTALQSALSPTALQVVDDSAQHAGHAGAREGGQTHYSVLVVSPQFQGLGRVARHRLVNAALADEFEGGLHALSLILRTPEEASQSVPV